MISTTTCFVQAINDETVYVTWGYSDDETFSTQYDNAPITYTQVEGSEDGVLDRDALVAWLRTQVAGPNHEEDAVEFSFADGI